MSGLDAFRPVQQLGGSRGWNADLSRSWRQQRRPRHVAIDLANRPESASLAEVAHVSLICSPDEARQRLKRIEQLGFDEVLIVSHLGVLEDIERARDFV